MTRPADIPADVWESAGVRALESAATALRNLDQDDCSIEVRAIRIGISRAIMAETKRAAEVCRAAAKEAKAKGLIHEALGAVWCAKSILKGTP